jgi:hydroxyacylglutathione hydrolase
MNLETIHTPGLALRSYLLWSGPEALVVDPRRDIGVYLELLRTRGLRLRYILETHRQEDFVLGSAELGRRTGAEIVGGVHSNFRHASIQLPEGKSLGLGRLKLRALPTPGHTQESTCFAVSTGEEKDLAWAVFTGDALFAGSTGRTDLSDPAHTAKNAGALYDALRDKLLPLGDQTLVLPAHGPGSQCGAAIAAREPTTLGFERRTNPVFTRERDDFIRMKLLERLPRPPWFARIRDLNTKGGKALPDVDAVPMLPSPLFLAESAHGVVIDAREAEAFAGGHLPGSFSIWMEGLSRFAGWIADEDSRIFLVLEQGQDVREAVISLARVGLDGVAGILAGGIPAWRSEGLPLESSGTITPSDLADEIGSWQRLDVREISEYEEDHIPGINHVPVGELPDEAGALPFDRDLPVVVTCGTGHRSSLGASILLRHGFKSVHNLLGGMTAWRRQELPVEEEATARVTEVPPSAPIEEWPGPV